MPQVILDIPTDAQAKRVVDALCLDGGWSAELGISRVAFAKRCVAQMVKERVRIIETMQARTAALASVTEPADVDIT